MVEINSQKLEFRHISEVDNNYIKKEEDKRKQISRPDLEKCS